MQPYDVAIWKHTAHYFESLILSSINGDGDLFAQTSEIQDEVSVSLVRQLPARIVDQDGFEWLVSCPLVSCRSSDFQVKYAIRRHIEFNGTFASFMVYCAALRKRIQTKHTSNGIYQGSLACSAETYNSIIGVESGDKLTTSADVSRPQPLQFNW
jgi:hypothetical protein